MIGFDLHEYLIRSKFFTPFSGHFMKRIFLLAALAVPVILSAQPIGYAFLRTSAGARPSAMASSFVAMSNDPHCVFYNPAGLADLSKRAASFGYLNHILDIQNFNGVYVMPLRKGRVGFGVQYNSYGEFARMNEFGQELGTFGSRDGKSVV